MKVQDLRIGNLILDIDGNIGKVTHISETSIKVDNANIGFSDLSLKPIPITEEWLLRFGFEKNDNGFTFIKYIRKMKIGLPPNERIIGAGHRFLFTFRTNVDQIKANGISVKMEKRIQYIHQLQNLYFALTGEELKLTI